MGQINPFSGYLNQSTAVQRTQQAEKARQERRADALKKNSAAEDDHVEHEVESSDAIVSIHEEQHQNQQQPPKHPHPSPLPEEPEDTLDLTA